jgi:hypothetical protein
MEDLYKQARISRVSQCTKLAVHETGFACRPSRSADEQVHFSTSDNVTTSVPSPQRNLDLFSSFSLKNFVSLVN